MANSSVTHIVLGAYSDLGLWGALLVLLLLGLFVLMVVSNALLLGAIWRTRDLQQPMFVFLAALLVNELYGGSCVVLFVAFQLLSDVHAVPAALCHLQVFQIYSYVSVEFTCLAVMSYDRYVAVCFPLQYAARMNRSAVAILVVLMWAPPLAAVGITVMLTASLTLCGDVIDEVYCDNYSIVKLACGDTAVNNWYELVAAGVTVFCPLSVIAVTYVHILRVCLHGSVQMRQKALTTCTPHLCSLLNFAVGVSFQVVQTRFDTKRLPRALRAFLPLYLLTAQPIFNPLVYGLKLANVRAACRRLVFRKTMS